MMFQKTLEKMRKNEGGFTLIELLVVMLIIGILAAIAIPVFLSQKEKAQESAIKNDVRNAATYAETFAVDNSGSYTGFTIPVAEGLGFKHSDGVTVTVKGTPGTNFCLNGNFAAGGTTKVYQFSSTAGHVELVGAAGVTAC